VRRVKLTEKVVKRGNKWCVIHCHGARAGQIIACHDSKAKADAQHRAIMAGKQAKEANVWKVKCPKCGSIFSSAIWEISGKKTCPECGFSNFSRKDFIGKYVEKRDVISEFKEYLKSFK